MKYSFLKFSKMCIGNKLKKGSRLRKHLNTNEQSNKIKGIVFLVNVFPFILRALFLLFRSGHNTTICLCALCHSCVGRAADSLPHFCCHNYSLCSSGLPASHFTICMHSLQVPGDLLTRGQRCSNWDGVWYQPLASLPFL